MNIRNQLICLWCGPVAVLLLGTGFMPIAGLIPPPSPSYTSQQIFHTYFDHPSAVRLGLLMVCMGGGILGPWIAVISTQLKRIEGTHSPLTYTNLGLGMLTLIVFVLPPMVMQTIAFRADRDPSSMLALQDLAWLSFVGIFSFPTVQCLAIALCVLTAPDQSVLPRWFGYFNAWVGLGFAPAATIYWFKSGPLAWNGIIPFWLPIGVFFIWMIVNTAVVRSAILRQGAVTPSTADVSGGG